MMKELAVRTALVLCSIMVTMLAAEGLLRVFSDGPLTGSWRVYDQRGLSLNKSAGRAAHAFGDWHTTYVFRPPHLRSGGGASGRHKILALGDSFTFGWLLDWPDTYIAHFENRMASKFGRDLFQVANAAAGGWGVADYLAYLEGYGPRVDPDIVLVFLNTGDISRLHQSGLYRLEGERLIAGRKQVPLVGRLKRYIPFYEDVIEGSHLLNAMREVYIKSRFGGRTGRGHRNIAEGPGFDGSSVPAPPDMAVSVKLTQRIFLRMRDWSRRRGVRLAVVTTAWHNPPYTDNNVNERFMATASTFFAANEIPFFDGSAELVGEKLDPASGLVIEGDGHPTPAGAWRVAEINWPFIESVLRAFCSERDCIAD